MSAPYQPDFDSSFPPGAPRDDRVATPDKARKEMPSRAGKASGGIPWTVVGLGAVTAIGIAVALGRK